MAMIKCSECGKEISEKAKICPNCGNPIRHKQERLKRSIISIMLVIVVIGGVCIIGTVKNSNKNRLTHDVYKYGKQAVSIVDSLIDGNRSLEATKSEIESLKEKVESVVDDDNVYDSSISADLTIISITLISIDAGNDSISVDLMEDRNDLAKDLGLKER